MLVSLCAETIKPVFEGDKIWQLWKEMHQFIECISCKSYITGEGRAELLRACMGLNKREQGGVAIYIDYLHYSYHTAIRLHY